MVETILPASSGFSRRIIKHLTWDHILCFYIQCLYIFLSPLDWVAIEQGWGQSPVPLGFFLNLVDIKYVLIQCTTLIWCIQQVFLLTRIIF